MKQQASKLEGIAKYVVLMLDELSVQDDLVYNSSTNELIGFVNLGDEVNEIFKKGTIVSHALVFMVCGIASNSHLGTLPPLLQIQEGCIL